MKNGSTTQIYHKFNEIAWEDVSLTLAGVCIAGIALGATHAWMGTMIGVILCIDAPENIPCSMAFDTKPSIAFSAISALGGLASFSAGIVYMRCSSTYQKRAQKEEEYEKERQEIEEKYQHAISDLDLKFDKNELKRTSLR